MSRLFWKIFLSFWLTLILFTGAGLFSVSVYLERMRAQNNTESPRERMISYASQAQLIAANEGLTGLKTWLTELDAREAFAVLLIDTQGADLLGRPVPDWIQRRQRRHFQPGQGLEGSIPPPRGMRGSRFHHSLIRLPDGAEYQLMPDFKSVTLGRVLKRPRVIAFPLILAALASALVCYLLAGYLTRPLRRLSLATRRFASGDLSQRVTPAMGGRRDEITQLARDFDFMAERLQQVIGSHHQLLSDVSHELRSPLARLQIALGLARQRSNNASNMELDRIEREAERLNELIGQLLSLSRLESDPRLSSSERVDLQQMLTELVADADFEARAAGREVRLIRTTAAVIEATPTFLRSALENVIRNAVKYTAANTAVELSLQRGQQPKGWVTIKVRDHGAGVPDTMLSKLFEPFVRVGDTRDRKSGGYGLGLAITKRAVRLHGGDISAANHPAGGLVISIRLPQGGRAR